jgi:flagellar M-ring protein FliF
MADKLKQIPQKLLDIWKSWSVKQRVLIIGSIVAFIAVVSIVAIVLTRPKYEVLVTCEDYTEMNSVTTLLTDNNHKYKINNMVVSVNSKELTACKMLLASQNIQSDGYTFEDAMKRSFTTTDSDSMPIILRLSLRAILRIWTELRMLPLQLICLRRLIHFIRQHQMLQ